MRAASAYCDGWMPTVRGEAFFAKLGEFRELLAQSGREPKTLAIDAYDEPAGKLDQDHRALARFTEARVGSVQLGSPGDPGQGIGERRGVGEADGALGGIAQSESGESQRQTATLLGYFLGPARPADGKRDIAPPSVRIRRVSATGERRMLKCCFIWRVEFELSSDFLDRQ